MTRPTESTVRVLLRADRPTSTTFGDLKSCRIKGRQGFHYLRQSMVAVTSPSPRLFVRGHSKRSISCNRRSICSRYKFAFNRSISRNAKRFSLAWKQLRFLQIFVADFAPNIISRHRYSLISTNHTFSETRLCFLCRKYHTSPVPLSQQ